jgi:2-polyprenyl-3-methyl-5-hydroxy-6-metoxy-1,4-benzoquinol methylase
MRDDINIVELEKEYLRHTDYHLFSGGRKRLREIVRLCEQKSRQLGRRLKVLDIGCGNGSNSLPVASLGHYLLGIDISSESVEYANDRNPFPNARFMIHNLMEHPLSEKFDLIICSEVLEHLPDPRPMIRAMAEVLEAGGLVVITVPNGYGPREVLGRLENRLKRSHFWKPFVEVFRQMFRMSSAEEKCRMHTSNPDQDHVQKFTPWQLKHLIKESGLRVTEWVNSFWLLSLFGKAKAGMTFVARVDSWLADIGPAISASGWYVICEKPDE